AVRDALARFRQAGVLELYAVLSLADIPGPGPFVLVPLEGGANADAVRQALAVLGTETTDTINGVVFAGGRSTRERLRLKPSARPDLEPALAAVAQSPVQLVLVPGPDQRRVAAELLPKLPPELGGGPSTFLARDVRWAAAGLDVNP